MIRIRAKLNRRNFPIEFNSCFNYAFTAFRDPRQRTESIIKAVANQVKQNDRRIIIRAASVLVSVATGIIFF